MFSFHQERLGAVACLQLAVKHFEIDDHVVVIGGYVSKFTVISTTMQSQVLRAVKSSPVLTSPDKLIQLSLSLSPILNSDTLFKEDFSLGNVSERFSDLQAKHEDSCLVLSYQCKDEGEFYSICIAKWR